MNGIRQVWFVDTELLREKSVGPCPELSLRVLQMPLSRVGTEVAHGKRKAEPPQKKEDPEMPFRRQGLGQAVRPSILRSFDDSLVEFFCFFSDECLTHSLEGLLELESQK